MTPAGRPDSGALSDAVFVEAGGQGASSIAEAVKDADVIITMVPDSPDVAGAARGLLGGVRRGERERAGGGPGRG